MIELTDMKGQKFYLNVMIVERVIQVMGGSEIILTNGRSAVCEENAKHVAERIAFMQVSMSGVLSRPNGK